MTEANLKGEGASSLPPSEWNRVKVTEPPKDHVQTGNEALVSPDGKVLAPIVWTNKTCSDWAPISVHHIRLSRQRMNKPDWKDKISILSAQPEREGTFILVGSSPYVTDHVEQIKAEAAKSPDNVVFAINSAVNLVLANDIRLDGVVLFEGGPDNHVRKFQLPSPESVEGQRLTAYMASWCHPHQWGKMRDYRIVMWHGWSEVKAQLDEYHKFPYVVVPRSKMHSLPGGMEWEKSVEDYGIIGGGSTTFSRTVNIGFTLGFRKFELYGFDSSFEQGGESHYIMSDVGKALETITVTPRIRGAAFGDLIGPQFHCKPFMARQAHEFMGMLSSQTPNASPNPWLTIPNRVRMHGPGLLPWMHKARFPQHYEGQ
jgi:hypothetical protein